MARTQLDTEDAETLDGADVSDRAPEPDDEDQRTTRALSHARARARSDRLSQVRRRKRRAKNLSLENRR